MIASSLLIGSLGFLIYSANRAFAKTGSIGDVYVVANKDGIFAVKQNGFFSAGSFTVIKIK
jgi:hypothetical protein